MRRGDAHKSYRKTVLTFNTSQQCLRILLMCFRLCMSEHRPHVVKSWLGSIVPTLDKTGSTVKFNFHYENGSLILFSVTSVEGISWERFGPGTRRISQIESDLIRNFRSHQTYSKLTHDTGYTLCVIHSVVKFCFVFKVLATSWAAQ